MLRFELQMAAIVLIAYSAPIYATPSGKNVVPAVIPTQFQGEWNEDIQACGKGINDSELHIGPKMINYYESDGEIRKVILHNNKAITVTASYTGEGQVWDSTVQFVLWGTNALSQITDGNKFVRYRCPSKYRKYK
jgi:hypothetical protein